MNTTTKNTPIARAHAPRLGLAVVTDPTTEFILAAARAAAATAPPLTDAQVTRLRSIFQPAPSTRRRRQTAA